MNRDLICNVQRGNNGVFRDWATAQCTVSVRYTPEDVYGEEGCVSELVAHVPSFLQITGFRPPSKNELYLSVFGFVLVQDNTPEDNKPRFIIELKTTAKGTVVCPHCKYDAMMFAWAPGTDYVGCPQCGHSVTKLVPKL
jgi:hypothetical protein